jgi:hypothetical protein
MGEVCGAMRDVFGDSQPTLWRLSLGSPRRNFGATLMRRSGPSGTVTAVTGLRSAGFRWIFVAMIGSAAFGMAPASATAAFPSCRPISAITAEGQPVKVQLNCVDPARGVLRYGIPSLPAYGSLGGFDSRHGTITYTPVSGYGGTDTFTYNAWDGSGAASSQTVSVTVTGSSGPGSGPLLPRPGLNLSAAEFRGPTVPERKQTTLLVTLSEAATVIIDAWQTVPARIVGGICKAGAQRGPRCYAIRRTREMLMLKGVAGQNRIAVRFQRLEPGGYGVTVSARNNGGDSFNSSGLGLIVQEEHNG